MVTPAPSPAPRPSNSISSEGSFRCAPVAGEGKALGSALGPCGGEPCSARPCSLVGTACQLGSKERSGNCSSEGGEKLEFTWCVRCCGEGKRVAGSTVCDAGGGASCCCCCC